MKRYKTVREAVIAEGDHWRVYLDYSMEIPSKRLIGNAYYNAMEFDGEFNDFYKMIDCERDGRDGQVSYVFAII